MPNYLHFIIPFLMVMAVYPQLSLDPTLTPLNNPQSQLLTPAYSISTIFNKYPTSQELNEIILSADSFVIIKLIQNLMEDDSLSCDYAITYLMEIDGRIKSALEQKIFSTDRLRIIINAAEDQIRRLNIQILRYRSFIDALMLEQKKKELEKMVASLLSSFNTLNTLNDTLKAKEQQIQEAQQQIVSINTELDLARGLIVEEKLAVTEVQAEIRNLQARLKDAQGRKNASLAFVAQKEKQMEANHKKIADLRNKIGALDFQINGIKDNIVKLQLKINQLQVDSERLRSDIAEGEIKKTEFLNDIQGFQERIRQQQKKLQYSLFDSLINMREALKNLLPGIQFRINEQYYKCFAEGLVKVEKIGSLTFFSINGMELSGYIKNAYGIDMPVSFSLRDTEVLLQPISILSKKWTNRYGSAISNTTLEETQDFSQLTNFWCISPSLLSGGYGIVLRISATEIQIRKKEGGDIRISLSACSRMESQIATMPEIGQQIFWKGSSEPNGKGFYEAHMATFLR